MLSPILDGLEMECDLRLEMFSGLLTLFVELVHAVGYVPELHCLEAP